MTRPTTEATPVPGGGEAQHWRAIHTALAARIRGRWQALATLAPEAVDWDLVGSALAAAAAPEDLLRLLDQVDRRLDAAFSPQARRTRARPPGDAPGHADPRSFK